MLVFRSSRLIAALLLGLALTTFSSAGVGQAAASSQARGDVIGLAQAVERRALLADFAALEAFGEQALTTPGREGLNRLYHVTWILMNQAHFERAARWNDRLAASALRQNDARYVAVARINALRLRYETGDKAARNQSVALSADQDDWFVKAHAARVRALALLQIGKIGEALKATYQGIYAVPEGDPFADTANAGLFAILGIGLQKLADVRGATDAYGRSELEFNRQDYPRPDFDVVHNMAGMMTDIGDQDQAQRLYQVHHRLAERVGMDSLSVYDAGLCARVADGRDDPSGVLACVNAYGEDLGVAKFRASQLLPLRAAARARMGDIRGARRDLVALRRLDAAGSLSEEGSSRIRRLEAEILNAEGRSSEAFALLRAQSNDAAFIRARKFSAGIGQVTAEMQTQLSERRHQLETERANTALQADVIRGQGWIVGISLLFLVTAAALLYRQSRLSDHLRTARHRAEDASRSKSEFLANMSHEIRTPLNGVVAMADALSRRPLDPAEHEMAEIIRSSGVMLERLLSDILDSAKIEAGQIAIEIAPFALGQAVRDIIALWGPKVEGGAVKLEVHLDPALDRAVMGDVVRVRQILNNLVSNALKFTKRGSVTLSVEAIEEERVRFTVQDTGVGFDADQKNRIFGRFQQADGSITRRFGGTGLGLAISRQLAELMGGVLDCNSTPGQGSHFWFELPLPPANGCHAASSAPLEDDTPGRLNILLADDHPVNRQVIAILLDQTDVRLTVVDNGREAVEAFNQGAFDLVLMDMQMPVMDGLTATAAIRALEVERGQVPTPIVMLTANALAEHVAAGRAAGADGHLTKPITTETLFAAIASALDVNRPRFGGGFAPQ